MEGWDPCRFVQCDECNWFYCSNCTKVLMDNKIVAEKFDIDLPNNIYNAKMNRITEDEMLEYLEEVAQKVSPDCAYAGNCESKPHIRPYTSICCAKCIEKARSV